MISIIDFGAGNLQSVRNALSFLNCEFQVVDTSREITKAKKIIFPGVGNFGSAIDELQKKEVDSAISKSISLGVPFLGICLGMQLLFEKSEESFESNGLKILKGKVIEFQKEKKVPQIGWNSVKINKESKMFEGIDTGEYFYFVNSFYPKPENKNIISGETKYGEKFASAIEFENIWAVQFHPEKSGKIGLKLIENFIKV